MRSSTLNPQRSSSQKPDAIPSRRFGQIHLLIGAGHHVLVSDRFESVGVRASDADGHAQVGIVRQQRTGRDQFAQRLGDLAARTLVIRISSRSSS